jgi:hypothetical protein
MLSGNALITTVIITTVTIIVSISLISIIIYHFSK